MCRRVGRRALLLLLALLPLAPARAHIGDQYDSVHFHSGNPDFGTVPRRGRVHGELDDRPLTEPYGMNDGREIGVELTQTGDENRRHRRAALRAQMLRRATADAQVGQWARARRAYEWALRRFRPQGSLRDRVEVLQQVERLPRPLSTAFSRALRRYLSGLDLDDAGNRADARTVFQSVYEDPASGFLREHALYQLASLAWAWWDFPRAIALYQQLLQAFPRTHKREAALLMIARCALLPRTAEGRQPAMGRAALAQLEREFPRTRFRRSMAGLRARLDFLSGRCPAALDGYFALDDLESVEIVRRTMPAAHQGPVRVRLLAAYLRRLAHVTRYATYRQVLDAIERTRKAFRPADAVRFTQLLLAQPDLAAPYFYCRLYHGDNRPADFIHLARLADAIAARHPSVRLPPLVRVRLAEVYYQRGHDRKALPWAERALAPRRFDRALFVHGAVLHRLGRHRAALADFEELLRRYPHSPLRRGAREEAAILYEATGDLGGALDQYFELGYQADIAFLLDVRMTIGEMERLLRSRSLRQRYSRLDWGTGYWRYTASPETRYDLVAYSLGIRYFREGRWDRAERWLRRVPRARLAAFQGSRPDYYESFTYVPDALKTLRSLRRLERAVRLAPSRHARAAALYRYATYLYTRSQELFYNAALWEGTRAANFGWWWNRRHATPADTEAARAHHYQHETYARTEALCREIVRRYPDAPVAPQALYRAACCERKLADFNGWWREDNKRRDHWKAASRLMRQVARRYPHHPLAHAARKYAAVFTLEKDDY